MEYKISGNNLQLVTVQIDPEEKIYAEAGAMAYMSANVNIETKSRGGILKGLGRKMAGESMFLVEFTSSGGRGLVSMGGNVPGTIKPLEFNGNNEFFIQKKAFLAATDQVKLDTVFQKKLGAGLFGGEGMIIQKLSGHGNAFIHACGDFIEYDLDENQTLKVDTACAVGWDGTVDYDIERIKGVKNMFLGGEGIFLTKLQGPGKVYLQSMSIADLAQSLLPYVSSGSR
ncbi:MAG: TIGR00266 family protein [Candidatus Thermoplasmatota archaeon]